jgi:hypothetical protein
LHPQRAGKADVVATIEVQPRQTPEERAFDPVEVEIEPELRHHAEIIEDWVAPRQSWDFQLREGHDFGRTNNVEGRLLFAGGEQTSSLAFRLEQLDAVQDFGEELVLRFEEEDGIAKTARATGNGLDVELFHILTTT